MLATKQIQQLGNQPPGDSGNVSSQGAENGSSDAAVIHSKASASGSGAANKTLPSRTSEEIAEDHGSEELRTMRGDIHASQTGTAQAGHAQSRIQEDLSTSAAEENEASTSTNPPRAAGGTTNDDALSGVDQEFLCGGKDANAGTGS
ncbi:unnamed protein product, partial [Amoebophrya sp. A25]|eukprot:GSA25T00018869001.1